MMNAEKYNLKMRANSKHKKDDDCEEIKISQEDVQ